VTTITLPIRTPSPAHPILRIAAVEGVRIVRHPAFVIGLVLSLLFVRVDPLTDGDWAGQGYFMLTTSWVWVWVGTLLAAASVAGRDRWLGEPDLFPGVPVTRSGRIAGAAVALAAPTAITATAAIGTAIWFDHRGGFNLGDPPYTAPVNLPVAQWAQVPVLVVVAGAAGIAIAQLRRARLISLGGLTAVTWLCGIAPWLFAGAGPLRVLHPFMYPAYEQRLPDGVDPRAWVSGDPPLLRPSEYSSLWREVRFDTAALGWHLGYAAGLALVLLWAATRMADRDAHWRTLLVVGVVLVVGCGALQLLTAGSGSIASG